MRREKGPRRERRKRTKGRCRIWCVRLEEAEGRGSRRDPMRGSGRTWACGEGREVEEGRRRRRWQVEPEAQEVGRSSEGVEEEVE